MRLRLAVLVASLVVGGSAGAQVQVVVKPSSPQGWQTAAFGAGASGGWTTAYPRNGNGSAQISLLDAGAGEFDHYIDFASPMSLSGFTRLMFDWYRNSSSTTADWLAPAFALHMANGNTSGGDYLVYEYAYNHTGAAPTNSWIAEDILGGTFWRGTSDGTASSNCATYGMFTTLGAFDSQCYGGNAMVLGFDVFMGYSMPGTFDAGVDNVNFATSNDPIGTNYDFEADPVTTAPEPATLALIIPGALALIPLARRRKKA